MLLNANQPGRDWEALLAAALCDERPVEVEFSPAGFVARIAALDAAGESVVWSSTARQTPGEALAELALSFVGHDLVRRDDVVDAEIVEDDEPVPDLPEPPAKGSTLFPGEAP